MCKFYCVCLASVVVASMASFSARAADIVVVGNPSASAMTKDQISDVYLGKAQGVKPLDLSSSAELREEFYQKLTGRDGAQIKALWSRLTFTGKAQPPKELDSAAAVKQAIAGDAKAIGYMDKSAVDSSVKVLLELN